MLAKQARAILIADEVGGMDPKLMDSALTRLRQGTEIWLNGSAGAPMLFDRDWVRCSFLSFVSACMTLFCILREDSSVVGATLTERLTNVPILTPSAHVRAKAVAHDAS